jgi:hypothetical protein
VNCPTHGTKLTGGVPCFECVAHKTPIAVEETSEDIDDRLLAEANEYIGHSRVLWNVAERLIKEGTPLELNTAAKLSAESVKWARLAREIRGEVSQRRQLRVAIAHEKEMQGKRGSH